jgi:hypothetical protein
MLLLRYCSCSFFFSFSTTTTTTTTTTTQRYSRIGCHKTIAVPFPLLGDDDHVEVPR